MLAALRMLTVSFLAIAVIGIARSLPTHRLAWESIELITCPPPPIMYGPVAGTGYPVLWADLPGRGQLGLIRR